MHEKTAEEVKRAEWPKFLAENRPFLNEGSNWMIEAAFMAGFSAGRRGERIEVAARLMTVVLGQ